MFRTDLRAAGRGLIAAGLLVLASVVSASAQNGEYPEYPEYGYDEPGGYERPQVPGQGRAPRVQRTEGARYEWIVVGPAGEGAAVAAVIDAAGGSVIRTTELPNLGDTTTIATFPTEAARRQAQAELTLQAPDSSLSWHHLYNFAQSTPRIYAPALIGDTAPDAATGAGRCRLPRPMTIGMIDGPVNTDHPALRGVNVTFETLVTSNNLPSEDHATAVAALLVGEDPSGLLSGFARGARLHAISVFAEREQGEEASVERIAQAIDRLAGRGVRLINLSIAGPENAALGRAISAAAARGIVLVAASGNDRRPVVAWPAAAPEVIAVTAVDAGRRLFRRANTGAELEFSAPGVDIYAARARGAGYVSGTSFAAPIVTALAARHMAAGRGSAAAIRGALRAGVEPLGPGARNTDFGYGLVQGGC
ncbi:S8 family serine peptidase [Cereibacter sphaeroides]|nr:S8 family serine peptidase [Cereibacter sphaeroides]